MDNSNALLVREQRPGRPWQPNQQKHWQKVGWLPIEARPYVVGILLMVLAFLSIFVLMFWLMDNTPILYWCQKILF